jgi:hypothetical protein
VNYTRGARGASQIFAIVYLTPSLSQQSGEASPSPSKGGGYAKIKKKISAKKRGYAKIKKKIVAKNRT